MELITSCKNSQELNSIRKCIIEQVVECPIYFSSYRIIGTETQRINIETEEPMTDLERETITRILESLRSDDIFLYCGYDLPIKQLRLMNKHYNKIKSYKNVYYFKQDSLPEELIQFAVSFVKQFSYKHKRLDIDQKIARYTLGLRSLGITNITLEHIGGRLYVNDSDNQHHMNDQDLCQYIYNKMTESDEDVYYDVEDPVDQGNVENVKNGISPLMALGEINNFNKFRMMLSFVKLSNEENYPMLNPIDIHEMFDSAFGYKYFTLKFGKRLEEEFEDFDIKYYKEHDYYDLEEALAFSIYLSGLNIKHFIFHDNIIKTHTVCYSYIELLEPYPNYTDMKNRVVSLFCDITHKNYESFQRRYFHNMKLQTLMNSFIVDDTILFRYYNVEHINPFTHNPLPLYYYDCIKHRSDGLYNFYDITKGLFKHYPLFDRSQLKVRDTSISVENGIVEIDGVVVAKMEFKEPQRAHEHVCRCWKKGYFLTTFGLMYYIETGEISKHCITRPVWFSFNNSNETNLYKFLEFNNL
jgi:hypothetical protein